jgi:NADH-quinone oxidoreductase subunit J
MNVAFYVAAAVAVISTVLVITRLNPVHALVYLILSLLSVAVMFYVLGAPFVAALEVIIYAGAIMVLFVFAVMMLSLGPASAEQEREWLQPRTWVGPAVLAAILLAEVVGVALAGPPPKTGAQLVDPSALSRSLFGPYLLAVELASLLLLTGLVGAHHLGRREERPSGGEGK